MSNLSLLSKRFVKLPPKFHFFEFVFNTLKTNSKYLGMILRKKYYSLAMHIDIAA